MNNKRYKPALDKLFWIIWIITSILVLVPTILSVKYIFVFILMICVDMFTYYFMVSSLVGYVELREETLYVKFGFILKKEIPYKKIKEIEKERKIMSYSIYSIKNAIEHINIKYNKYEMITVSVVGNDDLIKELEKRIENKPYHFKWYGLLIKIYLKSNTW